MECELFQIIFLTGVEKELICQVIGHVHALESMLICSNKSNTPDRPIAIGDTIWLGLR